jgi:hypothetical protein
MLRSVREAREANPMTVQTSTDVGARDSPGTGTVAVIVTLFAGDTGAENARHGPRDAKTRARELHRVARAVV